MTNYMLDALNQFVEDVINETDDLIDLYLNKSKEDEKNIVSNSNVLFTFLGFIATALISGFFISSNDMNATISLVVIGGLILILYLRRNRELRKRNNAYGEKYSILSTKKLAFLRIRKLMNFYQFALDPVINKNTEVFTEKVYRDSLIALRTLEQSYDFFDFEFKKLFFIFQDLEMKKITFSLFLMKYSTILNEFRLLNNELDHRLPYFIADEITILMKDNEKYLPVNYKEPCAKVIPHNFYVSMIDYVYFKYGGLRNYYKTFGYQKSNLFFNTKFRKKFLLDQNFNILKIK